MSLKVLDGDGNPVTLASRQVTTTRNSEVSGNWGAGVVSQTDINSLPLTIEEAILQISNLIETIKGSDSFNTSVNRVSPPDRVLTNKRTFNSGGTTLTVTDVSIPDPTLGKTMAYCDLKASSSNQGPLYVGSSGSNLNSDNGRELDPGEPMTITIDDLSKIAVFSPNPGNSFSFIVYYEE